MRPQEREDLKTMAKEKQTLSLKVLNEKIEALTNKLELLLGDKKDAVPAPIIELFNLTHDGKFNNIKLDNELTKKRFNEFIDEYDNEFVHLTPLYVKFSETTIQISFQEFAGAYELVPQYISKYKNSLIEGKVRSISDVAPNFNQMSYFRFEQFIKWAGGVMLNWKTVLYLQILWLFIKKTKETKEEDYNWNTERYTGYQNTGKGIGEFLGIEQLFSGYTFFSLENNDDPLFALFKLMGMEKAEDYNDKFGYYRNFFDSRWYGGFNHAWNNDHYRSARLCKNPFEGVEGENLPFQDVKED